MKRYSEAMATIPSITATCPICDAVIEIKDFEPEIEEPITCPECDNDLDWEYDDQANVLELIEPDWDDEEEGLLIIGDGIEDEETGEDEA